MHDLMSEAVSLLEERLPLRAKTRPLSLRLAVPPASSDGQLHVTVDLIVEDDAGEIVDVFEVEQVLIPSLPGVTAAAATTYVDAWLEACQKMLEERGSDAFEDGAVPLYGADSDDHPLQTPDADRAFYLDAIQELRARQMDAVAAERAVQDQWMAVYGPTQRVFVRVFVGDDAPEELTGSHLGGLPYLPLEVDYPRDPSDGQPLRLAVQINFAEVPELDGFPAKGIFQLFVRNDDRGAGVLEPSCARVLFHAEVDVDRARLRSWFSFLPEAFRDDAPGAQERSLSFQRDVLCMSRSDHRFDALLAEAGIERSTIEDDDGVSNGSGHKLGGYPYCWTGDDVRGNDAHRDRGFELFLQLDSDSDVPMVWGRGQALKIHMSPEALARGDFSEVLFDVS